MRFVFVWMYFEAIFHILKPFGFLNTRRMWNGATILGPLYLSLTLVKIRHPHFFSCSHETCWKLLPHEVIIFTKFYRYQTTNVDFLLIDNFWTWALFFLFWLRLYYLNGKMKISYNTKSYDLFNMLGVSKINSTFCAIAGNCTIGSAILCIYIKSFVVHFP